MLYRLIQEMAEFEHLDFSMTEQILARDGFGARARFRVLIAEFDDEPAGYAFFFDSYSTFQGCGLSWRIYLFDLNFARTRLAGLYYQESQLLPWLEGCFGVMLHVLDWNESAINFYTRVNATFLDEWKTVCLKGDALRVVAEAGD